MDVTDLVRAAKTEALARDLLLAMAGQIAAEPYFTENGANVYAQRAWQAARAFYAIEAAQ